MPAGYEPDAIRAALRSLAIDDLRVDVVDGSVHLNGTARCYDVKRRAARRAEAAAPGSQITNELRVAQPGHRHDADAGREVLAALAQLPGDVLRRIRVEVQAATAHLYGMARTSEEAKRIEGAVWQAGGVSRVQSHLQVPDPGLDDRAVAAALTAYIERAVKPGRPPVVVTYIRGVASLSGSVSTTRQARAIEDLVRWHDRVHDVVNNLRVVAAPVVIPGNR